MADGYDKYELPEYVVSRVRYYDGEFLRDDEFIDEQKYHIDRRRRHDRLLHVSGVCEGLIPALIDAQRIQVSAGTAIDDLGRQILVDAERTLGVPTGAQGELYIELLFREKEDGVANENTALPAATRFMQDPELRLTSGRSEHAVRLGKARVEGGSVVAVTTEGREYSGLRLAGPGGVSYALRALDGTAAGWAELGCSLRVTGGAEVAGDAAVKGDATVEGRLRVTGGAEVAGDAAVKGEATVEGRLRVTGGVEVAGDATGKGWLRVTGGAIMEGEINVQELHVRAPFPQDDATQRNTSLLLKQRGPGGSTHTWCFHHAAVGGGDGVLPNSLEVWEYGNNVASGPRLRLRSDGDTLLVPQRGNVGIGIYNGTPAAKLHVVGDIRADGEIHGSNLRVINAFVKDLEASGSKKFVIDHPLDPKHRRLVHATLEGPEAGVYYRGEAQLSSGRAVIELPAYFEALTRREQRTVCLTPCFDGDGPISALAASPVANGRFEVRALDTQNPSQRFYWEVKAVRADVPPLEVEPRKATRARRSASGGNRRGV